MKFDDYKVKLTGIKMVAMDVDGTLTDKGVYYSTQGEALKRFSVHDGMGITLLNANNIISLIISSDTSTIPIKRAEKLKITHQIVGTKNKVEPLQELLNSINIGWDEVAYIGDDINDIPAMKKVGFSACPSDAVDSVKKVVDCILDFNGGNGAVRQLCEMVLLAQNKQITIDY